MGWIEEVAQRCTAQDAVQHLGLKTGRQGSVGPCPACNAEQRGSDDRRGPIGLRGDGKGWHCFRCKASGDALELLTLAWTGERMRQLSREQRLEVRGRLAAQGWCTVEAGGYVVPPAGGGPAPGKPAPAAPTPDPGWSVRQLGASGKPNIEPPPVGTGTFDWQPDLPDRCAASLWSDSGAQVLAYLQGRGFSVETLRHWKVGALLVWRSGKVVEQYVALPMPRRDGTIVGMRFRSVPGPCLHCDGTGQMAGAKCRRCKGKGEVRKVYLRCQGQESTLFGVHQLDGDEASEVIITEGELDVLALWQYGLRANVVSGTAGAGTWADSWLDVLEPYRHFLLAYDDDEKGHEGASKVAKALGLERCSRVVLPYGDAAECLERCVSQVAVHAALDAATPLLNLRLVKVDSYTDELERLIANPDALRGLPTGSARLDDGIGGWTPGLVVVTGDTAAGKTSFTTWCALEQGLRGVPVLLTSFEQRPIGSVQKLLRAQLGGDFTQFSATERKHGMRSLGQLPLFMLDHYGELNTTQLQQALDYSVRRLGVRVAVVDHLGFLVRGAEDERRAIEEAVRTLAVFAVQRDVTVVLICHPNNLSVVQQRRVQLGDLKGASAIRQDAHVGLVVERLMPGKGVKHPAAAVHCDKVRSEFGMQGARLTLYYDPEACVYADSWEATPMGSAGGSGGFRAPTHKAGPPAY